MADFKIEGLDEVLRKMRGLSQKLQKKGATAALRKGARVVVKAARANYAALGADDPDTKSNIGKAITNSRGEAVGARPAHGRGVPA